MSTVLVTGATAVAGVADAEGRKGVEGVAGVVKGSGACWVGVK